MLMVYENNHYGLPIMQKMANIYIDNIAWEIHPYCECYKIHII